MRTTDSADTIDIFVEPGHVFPNPGTAVISSSLLTGLVYSVFVKKISTLEWMADGRVHVRVLGTKKVLDGTR